MEQKQAETDRLRAEELNMRECKEPSFAELAIDEIIVEGHRRECGDVAALAASIARVGLLHRPVVRPGKQMVAGRRRLEALRLLGWTHVPVTVVYNLEDALAQLMAEADENTCRKKILPSEAVMLAKSLLPLAEAAARKRQAHQQQDASEKFSEAGDALAHVANPVGYSRWTLKKAMRVVDACEEDSAAHGDLLEYMDRTGRIHGAYVELRKRLGETEPPRRYRGFSVRMNVRGEFKMIGDIDKAEMLAHLKGFAGRLESEIAAELSAEDRPLGDVAGTGR